MGGNRVEQGVYSVEARAGDEMEQHNFMEPEHECFALKLSPQLMDQVGKAEPKRSCFALKPSLSQASKGVKAPEQPRLSRRQM